MYKTKTLLQVEIQVNSAKITPIWANFNHRELTKRNKSKADGLKADFPPEALRFVLPGSMEWYHGQVSAYPSSTGSDSLKVWQFRS